VQYRDRKKSSFKKKKVGNENSLKKHFNYFEWLIRKCNIQLLLYWYELNDMEKKIVYIEIIL